MKTLLALLLLTLCACEDGPVDTSLGSAPPMPNMCTAVTYDRGVHAFKYLCEVGDGRFSLAWLTPDGDFVRPGCFTLDRETCE